MPSEGTEADDVSERVARGFEALVNEESAAHGASALPAEPPVPGGPAPVPGAVPGEAPMSIAATRLVALEGRVRQTMDRLTELVEAQLPETVDGLRADLETLRLELQTSLAQATELMAEERQQLRTQIATTVGAANRWFVRARDQIHERLDQIAVVAAQAQAQAEVAAVAATAAVTAVTPPEPEEAPEEPEALGGTPALEGPEGLVALEAAGVDALAAAGVDAEPDDADLEDDEGGIEWEIEGEGPPRVATVDLAIEAPELEALLDPMRGDMQELQLEVASMGEAVTALADQLARLTTRMPARGRGVKLAPDQIELIVEAVIEAMPAKKAPAVTKKAAPPLKKKVAPPLKKAAPAAKKKAPGSRARGAILK